MPKEFHMMKNHTEHTQKPDFFSTVSPPVPPSTLSKCIRQQPECRLLWAILENGIETYMKYATATDSRGRRLYREAREWMMQDDPTWLCSFVSICSVLGIDPEYLREGLERWSARQRPSDLKYAA